MAQITSGPLTSSFQGPFSYGGGGRGREKALGTRMVHSCWRVSGKLNGLLLSIPSNLELLFLSFTVFSPDALSSCTKAIFSVLRDLLKILLELLLPIVYPVRKVTVRRFQCFISNFQFGQCFFYGKRIGKARFVRRPYKTSLCDSESSYTIILL